jgi:lambda family phage minor tail protein L
VGIESDLYRLAGDRLVELFELDATALGGAVSRFHNGANELNTDVVWQGQAYLRFPIEASGFEFTGKGSIPRPIIKVANVNGLLGALVRDYEDLVGAKVTRRRTLVKYLDAVNFPGGTNPSADPSAALPDDVYYIDRKSTENKYLIEFELAASFDVQGVALPRRFIVQNVCTFRYRSGECGYAGGAVAKADDTPTAVLGEDACGKRLASCRLRFGQFGELPFGGFPSAGLTR